MTNTGVAILAQLLEIASWDPPKKWGYRPFRFANEFVVCQLNLFIVWGGPWMTRMHVKPPLETGPVWSLLRNRTDKINSSVSISNAENVYITSFRLLRIELISRFLPPIVFSSAIPRWEGFRATTGRLASCPEPSEIWKYFWLCAWEDIAFERKKGGSQSPTSLAH